MNNSSFQYCIITLDAVRVAAVGNFGMLYNYFPAGIRQFPCPAALPPAFPDIHLLSHNLLVIDHQTEGKSQLFRRLTAQNHAVQKDFKIIHDRAD